VQHLQDNGITAFQAKDDADTVIVRTVLDIASKGEPVTVVADDTDILVLLVHHFKPDMGDMYMLSEITRLRSARMSVVAIREVRESIGTTASQQLLAVHALSGCDSTSALYGHGKGSVFRKLVHDASTLPLTETLTSEHASQAEVVQAGLKLLLMLYSGKPDETLNHLRFRDYMNMIATGKSRLRPERLPPTERAAHFHILRVHLQVVQWHTLMAAELNPQDWGWKLTEGTYVAIPTDMLPAPDDMLSVIACKCKTTTKNPCSSMLCSCRKNGMHCMAACKHCCGEECENVHQLNSYADETFEVNDGLCFEDDDESTEDDDVLYHMLDGDWADEEVVDCVV